MTLNVGLCETCGGKIGQMEGYDACHCPWEESLSRPMTSSEMREAFLDGVRQCVDIWTHSNNASERDKLEGLAHSLLVLLDGQSNGIPPFHLIPELCEDHIDEAKEVGNNWWVEDDITEGTMLHDQLYTDNWPIRR